MGDGNNIDSWTNPWLKKFSDNKAIPPNQNTPTSYKFVIVKDIFTTADTSLITSIHLSKQSTPNNLIWRETASGMFIMKSGYFVVR